jgi:hypothetical protein
VLSLFEGGMACYYFDIYDPDLVHDDVGVECADLEAVRLQAKRTLPEIARDLLPKDGDHHFISVVVRDEWNQTVYTATLAFSGLIVGPPSQARS